MAYFEIVVSERILDLFYAKLWLKKTWWNKINKSFKSYNPGHIWRFCKGKMAKLEIADFGGKF